MPSPTTRIIERLLLTALTLGCAASLPANGTTVDAISGNVNGMRELSTNNIVQRIPGAAPYYGPTLCQQLLPSYEAKFTAFDPAYTCTCPSQKQPPACQGPAHFNTATTTCTPETPFGSSVPAPLGGPNPQPQDWGENYALQQSTTTCGSYGSSCTSTPTVGPLVCAWPVPASGSTPTAAAVSATSTSCASLGLTTAWLTTYQGWGVAQASTVGGTAGYPNVCVAAVDPVGSPAPTWWPAPSAANPLSWPYEIVPCGDVGQPADASTAAAETCQVVQASCPPTFVEGFPYGAAVSMQNLVGGPFAANLPPSGYPGWDGPMITKTNGSDGCAARYACTGTPQSTLPVEMTCWGSYNNGLGSTGFGTMGSSSVPNGSAGGSYPDYNSTTVYPGPTAYAAWGCNGNGAPVPSNAIVTCSGPVCTVSLQITPSGSCANHIPPIQWNMYRDNYLPVCPAGTSYDAALNICKN